jgi:hypothetical protein
MSNFFRAVRAGVRGFRSALGPGRFAAAGRVVRCTHCGGEEFSQTKALMNSTALSLADLDWLDRSATVLVCTSCSLIQWFGKAPTRLDT